MKTYSMESQQNSLGFGVFVCFFSVGFCFGFFCTTQSCEFFYIFFPLKQDNIFNCSDLQVTLHLLSPCNYLSRFPSYLPGLSRNFGNITK